MGVTAIIQARMTSSRLPGKIVLKVLGKPLISHMVDRVKEAECVDKVVIATTINEEDDIVVRLASKLNINVYRGSERNVLERFYGAAERFGGNTLIRLTGDNPLIDPDLLGALVRLYQQGDYDYVSNCLEPTFPDGLDAEVFTMSALKTAYENAELPSELEHVTRYIYQRPTQFKLGCLKFEEDLSNMRWTVDEPEDFEFVKQVIERLYPENRSFRIRDVLNLLKQHPELSKINQRYQRNEGLLKSLQEDSLFHKDRDNGGDDR